MTASASADFQLLGVSPSSSFAEVRAAWRGLVRFTHPDISADASAGERMALINAAYDRIVAAIDVAIGAGADLGEAHIPTTHWADRWTERHAESRTERRAAAEVDTSTVRYKWASPYARDPNTIRRRYARVFA